MGLARFYSRGLFLTATGARHEKRSVIVGRSRHRRGLPLAAGPSAVVAANGPPPATLASGLAGPLDLSAGEDGRSLAAVRPEEFVGRLTRIDGHGTKKVLYENADWDVAGNAQQGSTTYFVESQGAGPMDPRPLAGRVHSIDQDGHQRTFGDFAALETAGAIRTRMPATVSATCPLTAQPNSLPRSLPLREATLIPIRTEYTCLRPDDLCSRRRREQRGIRGHPDRADEDCRRAAAPAVQDHRRSCGREPPSGLHCGADLCLRARPTTWLSVQVAGFTSPHSLAGRKILPWAPGAPFSGWIRTTAG